MGAQISVYKPIKGVSIFPKEAFNNESDFKKAESKRIEADFWNVLAQQETPDRFLKEREGSKGKMLEYVKVEYTIMMLNKFFPGWSCEDMQTQYIPDALQIFLTTGYLCLELVTPAGTQKRRVYAVGTAQIKAKRDDPNSASNPANTPKASMTDWLKLAGKLVGIGLDVYTQEITPSMAERYETFMLTIQAGLPEDVFQHLNERMTKIVQNITTVQYFRKFLNKLPDAKDTTDFCSEMLRLGAVEERIPNSEQYKISSVLESYLTLERVSADPKVLSKDKYKTNVINALLQKQNGK